MAAILLQRKTNSTVCMLSITESPYKAGLIVTIFYSVYTYYKVVKMGNEELNPQINV